MRTSAGVGELTGRRFLIILLSFFAVAVAANGIFLVAAIRTMPGELSGASFQTGLRYNQTLAEARAQEALGWRHHVKLLEGADRLRFTLNARNADPVADLTVTGAITRPATNQGSRKLAFREVEPGVYEARFNPLDLGQWIIDLEAKGARKAGTDSAPVYRIRERLWLQ